MSCASSANSHVVPSRTPSRASSLPQWTEVERNSCGSELARDGKQRRSKARHSSWRGSLLPLGCAAVALDFRGKNLGLLRPKRRTDPAGASSLATDCEQFKAL
ncbi:hypothetical protein FHK92_19715 [Pseudomonas brassicacearum subsp. neoaurantiaca]|uniref:Uncharacterized protein n=1 Tax=Pseudomonas brassicacearum subsp. neoaurantiaca TaxID=494916 RepID=A0A7V8UEB5_9PSED|nr:hypothetical protein [Pseudomonas brassicacearum subsp. neoaurantiaca]